MMTEHDRSTRIMPQAHQEAWEKGCVCCCVLTAAAIEGFASDRKLMRKDRIDEGADALAGRGCAPARPCRGCR